MPDKVSYTEKILQMEEVNHTHCFGRCNSFFSHAKNHPGVSREHPFLPFLFLSKMESCLEENSQIECKSPHDHLGPAKLLQDCMPSINHGTMLPLA